jgi:hypothetical protein
MMKNRAEDLISSFEGIEDKNEKTNDENIVEEVEIDLENEKKSEQLFVEEAKKHKVS